MSKPIGREEGHDRRGHHAIDHHRAHRYSGPPLGVVPPRCTTPASRNGVSGNWLEEPRPSSRRKYAPSLPFRAFLPRPARHLPKALDASLTRLGRSSVDLYQIHYPVPDLQRRPYEPSRRQRRGGQDPSGRRIQLLRPTTAGSLRAAAGPRHHTGVKPGPILAFTRQTEGRRRPSSMPRTGSDPDRLHAARHGRALRKVPARRETIRLDATPHRQVPAGKLSEPLRCRCGLGAFH
jgi:hypothetical protein